METERDASWHALDTAAVVERLRTSPLGLSHAEAQQRLHRYGPNQLPARRGRPAWLRFLAQFHNLLIYLLLVAAVVTASMGHAIDTVVILAVVVINAVIGYIQEGRAERSLEAILSLLTDACMVEREGRRQSLPTRDLVPGDVVFIQSGDRIPADMRLLSCRNLRLTESALTGESLSVAKRIEPVAMSAALGDRACMAFSGTFVATGQGTGVVVATGQGTELGRIQGLLAAVPSLRTPLLEEVDRFARVVSVVVGILAAAAFIVGWGLRGYAPGEMFMVAVALAVAAIPEGLPAILSITLAIGVQRMAQRKAIIRRLPAVDTLGAVDVICSDKTGTLTCNEMMVTDVVVADGTGIRVDGEGYAPTGAFARAEVVTQVDQIPGLLALARCGVLCSDARLTQVGGRWNPVGDPIEAALVALAMKAGLDPADEAVRYPRADVIPFESEHRFMATLHRDHAGGGMIYVKGAPEVIFSRCQVDAAAWTQRVHVLAQRGRRVLALAALRVRDLPGELTFASIDSGLELLGIVGAIDPPRSEAIAAIAECHGAGIRVAMITGDHAITAQAIAAELGIRAQRVLTGADLDGMKDEALRDAVGDCEVFARVSPEHKLRIVDAMQARGRTIAMTGDGVNDAPALKRAHIGVAMGLKGTEVAKESADMVLADDNFASIAVAVREGRTAYENLRKTIVFTLPTNGGESLVLLAALIGGLSMPLTPVQILWINLVTSVTLALALAVEPGEVDLMRRPPRPNRAPLLSGYFIWRIALVSVLMCVGCFGIFFWFRHGGASLEVARTVAVNLMVVFESVYVVCSRSVIGPVLGPGRPLGNPWIWAAITSVMVLQVLYTYLPLSQTWFGTAAIPASAWVIIAAAAAVFVIIVEGEKAIQRRRGRRQA